MVYTYNQKYMKINLVFIIIKHPKKILTILRINSSDESDNMLEDQEEFNSQYESDNNGNNEYKEPFTKSKKASKESD